MDAIIVILGAGTLVLLVGWPLVAARLTRYSARDHRKAQLRHWRKS